VSKRNPSFLNQALFLFFAWNIARMIASGTTASGTPCDFQGASRLRKHTIAAEEITAES